MGGGAKGSPGGRLPAIGKTAVTFYPVRWSRKNWEGYRVEETLAAVPEPQIYKALARA